MSFLLDLGVILLFIIFVVEGFHRGVVRSLLDLVGAIVSLLLASYLASVFSEMIYHEFISGALIEKIDSVLKSNVTADVNTQITAMFEDFPQFVTNSLGVYGITASSINDIINHSAGNAPAEIESMISPVVINGIRTILVGVVFIVLMAVIGTLVRSISRIFHLPILKQLNQLLGIVFGALKCVIILLILTLMIRVFVPMFNPVPQIFSEQSIESTFIFKHIYDHNPLYSALKGLGV